jgi:hypothetical protein
MSDTSILEQPLSRQRNITVFEELNEILLDLQDIASEPLPSESGSLIDQGLQMDQIVKTCTARLEAIKALVPQLGGEALHNLQSKALSSNTGGSLALNGFSGMVVIRVGKAATRINSDKIKADVTEAELKSRGWLKTDTKPSTSISFSRKVA